MIFWFLESLLRVSYHVVNISVLVILQLRCSNPGAIGRYVAYVSTAPK